ncbi:MAG TPA: MFS transporter [Casimicrobiaceae bacterium]|nr:MFS transporter [Casimicrobiaceae bacterium]
MTASHPGFTLPMQANAAPGTETVRMTRDERRATTGLAGIYGLRMLGMFIILPVFALYAETLPGGANQTMVGIALGAYGLTQAVLQVPFGWASDRYGRKRTIVFGLVLFALGSFVAAWAPDIYWTIAGRTLQGAGAISAAVIALTADLTRDSVRTKAMAVIGMTIGGTFALSLVAGPLLKPLIGVPGIFAMTGVLALAAIGALRWAVPAAPPAHHPADESGFGAFRRVLHDGQLARLNYGIFALHALLMALFVQVPFELREAGLPGEAHWKVYLPVLVASVALMMPALRFADRPARSKLVFNAAVAVLAVAQLVLALAGARLWPLVTGLAVFFTAFNLLEATLPSLVSKYAPPALKGTAVGVYSSVQFLGTFVGAAAGGWLAEHHGAVAVFGFGIVLTLVWLALSATMAPPPALRSGNYSMGET